MNKYPKYFWNALLRSCCAEIGLSLLISFPLIARIEPAFAVTDYRQQAYRLS